MQLPDETIDDLTRRLRRIEGQVRGIQQMLTESRECRDIVAQVSGQSLTCRIRGAWLRIVALGLLIQAGESARLFRGDHAQRGHSNSEGGEER